MSISSFNADQIILYFEIGKNKFKAGRLKRYIQQCLKITGDKEVLETISGMKLDFENAPPGNNNLYEQHFSKEEENSINIEIKKIISWNR